MIRNSVTGRIQNQGESEYMRKTGKNQARNNQRKLCKLILIAVFLGICFLSACSANEEASALEANLRRIVETHIEGVEFDIFVLAVIVVGVVVALLILLIIIILLGRGKKYKRQASKVSAPKPVQEPGLRQKSESELKLERERELELELGFGLGLGLVPEQEPEPQPEPEPKKKAGGNVGFSGKFDLYVIKMPNEKPYPQVFKFGVKRKMSLQKMLKKCGILDEIPGVENIHFIAERGSVKVVNKSERTILAGGSALAGRKSRRLVYGERVVVCDGAEGEVVISPRFLYQAQKKV